MFAGWWINVGVGAGQFLLLAIMLVLLAYLCHAARRGRRERTPIYLGGDDEDVESVVTTERESVQLRPVSGGGTAESAV